MTDILTRKTRLSIRTPYTEHGREIIAEVQPWVEPDFPRILKNNQNNIRGGLQALEMELLAI